jgi:hypothetical protein
MKEPEVPWNPLEDYFLKAIRAGKDTTAAVSTMKMYSPAAFERAKKRYEAEKGGNHANQEENKKEEVQENEEVKTQNKQV